MMETNYQKSETRNLELETVFQSFKFQVSSFSHIAPLAVFRFLFGLMMFGGMIRFISKGWVYTQYIQPEFFFPYYGFEWIQPLPPTGMYLLFIITSISFLFVGLGLFYKTSSITAFLSFTYIELIDKSNYLNHYYFISIVCFLLIFVPANRYFSLDLLRKPSIRLTHVPSWTINIFRLQLGIVYFYAGLAKLNHDWLFEAMPLRIWLPAQSHLPIIGSFLQQEWTAYFFSWFGAIYDLSIPFLLLYKKTYKFAYLFVILFHIMTALLFPIGMFPYIMIFSTLIFFPEKLHLKIISFISNLFSSVIPKKLSTAHNESTPDFILAKRLRNKLLYTLLIIHFIFQLAFPFRYLFYPDNLFWTEEGFRFSWRVMLMEKAGTAFFYVQDKKTGKEIEITPSEYLTCQQEKMMSTQPDMILQFAHYLKKKFITNGWDVEKVRAEVYVTLNGSGSRPYINPGIDLTEYKDSWKHKEWIIPKQKSDVSLISILQK